MRNKPLCGICFSLFVVSCLILLSSLHSPAETPPLTGFPFQDETLRYRVTWPGGASLGEGHMKAHRIEGGRWEFELTLDASVLGGLRVGLRLPLAA